jgi:nucleoside-diphosphate-sugar epimerase
MVTGGSGVLGRVTLALLRGRGYEVHAPGQAELDLFEPAAVTRAVHDARAVMHLATRIPPRERAGEREAWRDNDRLRTEASRLLVDAAIAAGTAVYVQPSIAFVYPTEGLVDEETPVRDVPDFMRSALVAEEEAGRFAADGRRGVILRLGLLDGPGTRDELPNLRYGSTLHIDDAGRALVSALDLPSGIYNVCRDADRVSNERFKRVSGWRPER